MVITTHELQTSDVRHLHCSDPRVADEVAAVNRSLHRLDESVPALCDIMPKGNTNRGEVAA
jgi:hypothetical protein